MYEDPVMPFARRPNRDKSWAVFFSSDPYRAISDLHCSQRLYIVAKDRRGQRLYNAGRGIAFFSASFCEHEVRP